ncbi:Six-hairpin glycosidase-like protein [Aspergillus avenaceus]|uniref:Six-hairpin glycosidase-like protein n=1 Tax=Aspergillus avenaceus TaxID=36643 RepID=A0A5N6U140_ASPAV|nr:Six-hairpin glycosidase-like protein [Aspergillus avenaceus]
MSYLKGLAFASIILGAAALDAEEITSKYFGNDAAWYRDRIPLFESSSSDIQDVYYYRWNVFRAHQRDLGAEGYISTEFLNDVSWQVQPWALLIDAANFHLREGRWCRDRRFKEDYANFLYGPNGNPYQFSESMADGVWQGYLVDGVADDATAHLDAMQDVFKGWNTTAMSTGGYDTAKFLYWIQPLTDATEYTIASIDASGGSDGFTGGNAFRPSINSYQYANALAISNLAKLKGDTDVADSYQKQAEAIKQTVQDTLWNSTFEHFIDRFKVDNEHVKYWDFIRGRELVGYVPWTHDLPDNTEEYAQAWKHLLDSEKFAGKKGLRTNEPSYEYYMKQYRYEGDSRECQWNGPAWPYQITQVLTALGNLLDHYNTTSLVTKTDYTNLLLQYAQLHHNPDQDGALNLEEDYDPETGRPIVGLARSPHYFHSGFVDLVLSGFVGLRARPDDTLEINSLADPASITYFRAERIPYHGHDIAIQWDAKGTHYGTTGLIIEIDNKVVSKSPILTRLTVPLPRQSPPPTRRPIAVSIQLNSTLPPKASVSVPNADTEKVHAAIDGRVWFFPEPSIANGWDTPAGNGSEVWFEIDFTSATNTASAELAFFADDTQGFDVPDTYSIQTRSGDSWTEVEGVVYGDLVANGITSVLWDAVDVERVRVLFVPKEGVKVRLVEFKVFRS